MNFNEADYVMVNTPGMLRDMARRMTAAGVRIEIEAFDTGHLWLAKELVKEGVIPEPVLVQLCMGVPWGAPDDLNTFMAMVNNVPAGWHYSAFSLGRNQMAYAAAAILAGGNVRVGLEDNLWLDKAFWPPTRSWWSGPARSSRTWRAGDYPGRGAGAAEAGKARAGGEMRALVLLAALALASCVEAPPDPGEGKAFTAEARAECEAKGGRVGQGGLLPDDVCFTPMPDAGKACSTQADCKGVCLADMVGDATGGTCSKESPMFGCFDFFDEQGQRVGICAD